MPGCQNTWQMKFQAKYQIEYRLVGISRKNRFIRLVAQVCVSLIFVASSIEFVSDSCFQSLPALEASAWYSYTSVALICFDFPVQLARLNQQRSQAAKQLVGRICVHQCVLCRGDVGGEIFFPKSHCQLFRFRNELWRLQNVTRQYRIGIGWRSSQICCLCPGWSIGSMMFMKRGWMSKSQAAPRASNGTLF